MRAASAIALLLFCLASATASAEDIVQRRDLGGDCLAVTSVAGKDRHLAEVEFRHDGRRVHRAEISESSPTVEMVGLDCGSLVIARGAKLTLFISRQDRRGTLWIKGLATNTASGRTAALDRVLASWSTVY